MSFNPFAPFERRDRAVDPPILTNHPYWLEGRPGRPACLLLHGLGGGAYEMQLLGQHLHRQGWTVRAIHYPGHQAPATFMPTSAWPDWYASAERAYGELRDRYGSVAAIGFSTGCPLALRLAARHPVARLVLLSPFLALKPQWYFAEPEAAVMALADWVPHVPRLALAVRDRPMRAAAERVAFFRTFNVACVRSALELIAEVRGELPHIRVPTLTMQSVRDSVVSPTGARAIAENLGSDRRELVWLSASDHLIPLDLERQLVFERTAAFLETAIAVA